MICIIDCGTSWLEEIKKNLAELNAPYKVINLDEIEDCNFRLFSGIIISGAPTMLSQIDLKNYLKPFKFIRTAGVPILGICLGHQIIGLVHGSEIHAGKLIDKKEQIKIIKANDLFLGIESHSLFREEHSESITLPKGFHLLAKSDSCSNEAMKHNYRCIYGVQFHPEVSNSNGKKLFRNFLDICAKK